jgi:hypothetical protein
MGDDHHIQRHSQKNTPVETEVVLRKSTLRIAMNLFSLQYVKEKKTH